MDRPHARFHEGMESGSPRPARPNWPTGALVAAAAAVGLLVAIRTLAAIDTGGFAALLEVETLPSESFGIRWSDRTSWPVDAQLSAWEGLLRTIAALFLASISVATLNALILLAESSASRRGELAVRSALGATPWALSGHLLAELRTLTVAGYALGLVAGLAAGFAARLAWPHVSAPVLSSPPVDLVVALAALTALLIAAHLGGVRRVTRTGGGVSELRSGSRASADPLAVFVRKALSAMHVTVTATVLLVMLALADGPGVDASSHARPGPSTQVVEATSPSGGWTGALEVLADVPGLEAESLAAPGALVGLGIRDIAITECGACMRGGLPSPLWNALADHHVVGPGYFGLTGMELLEGRAFTTADDRDSARVAIVNRTFARTSFERGRPIGKRIRIGTDFDHWYTVIGVVENESVRALGADGVEREAVYLSSLQLPSTIGRIVVRGDDNAVQAARTALSEAGFDPGPAMSLEAFRARYAAPITWSGLVASALAAAALLLAVHGIYVVGLQTARRRRSDLAVRRAVGAPAWRIVVYVLAERLRVTAWGLAGFGFFGLVALSLVQGATGRAGPGIEGYLMIATGLTAVALMASVRAARESLTVEPTHLLD